MDDKETAQVLLDYFISVHIEENDRNLLYASRLFNDLYGEAYLSHNYNSIVAENTIEDFEISEREELELLWKTDEYKAIGPDDLHPKFLKECASVLSKPLSMLFNKIIKTGNLPNDWKRSHPYLKKAIEENQKIIALYLSYRK